MMISRSQRLLAMLLLGLSLQAGPWSGGVAAAQGASAPAPAFISDLAAELGRRSAEDKFAGAVMVARNGETIFQAAYGEADRERNIPNTLDTKFRFGSMGKMFTATAIMQLVEAGKVALDAPFGDYLKDYPNKDVARITIHQLLTHTGGAGDIFHPEYFERRLEIKEHIDYVKLFGERGLLYEPGTRWEYSNYGMVLLGRVIEVVSGQNYYDYLDEHIFAPAGMTSTGALPEEQHPDGLSLGYTKWSPENPHATDGPLRSNVDTLPYRGTAAGGGYSTVGDLIRYADALTSHRLLNAANTALLTTGKVETGRWEGAKYGYGFIEAVSAEGVLRFGHPGGAPGMNGELAIFPASGYAVAVLANLDPPAAQSVVAFIRDRLP